jgi:hypothetical protein
MFLSITPVYETEEMKVFPLLCANCSENVGYYNADEIGVPNVYSLYFSYERMELVEME